MTNATTHGHGTTRRTWGEAYRQFLMSRDESLILKVAPLLLLFGAPEILMSNLVPVVGEVADVGTFGLFVIVALRTVAAVRKYKARP